MSQDETSPNDNIIQGYEYDGITEYDNPCPQWLMYIFYFTLFLAVFYLGHHFGSSKSRSERLKAPKDEIQKIQAQAPEPLPEVSESKLVALLKDPVTLANGNETYAAKCAPCHGAFGEGFIGPNLVDNYWLHGKGKISDIANVIRSGIPDSGMVAWKERISEENILQIAVYIKSLKSTQPEESKEPEGELIED